MFLPGILLLKENFLRENLLSLVHNFVDIDLVWITLTSDCLYFNLVDKLCNLLIAQFVYLVSGWCCIIILKIFCITLGLCRFLDSLEQI